MHETDLASIAQQFVQGKMSRRELVQKASALGLSLPLVSAVLAACSSPSSKYAVGTRKEFHSAWPFVPPPTGTFNTFSTNAISLGPYWDLMECALGIYQWEAQQYIPVLATSWEIVPPDTFKVTLRQGVKWSDGSHFTSKDVLTTFTLLHVLDYNVWHYLGSVQADGDYTVIFKMKEPSSLVPYAVMRQSIRSNAVYGQFAQEAKALFDKGLKPDAKEVQDLAIKLVRFSPKEMVVTGPYQIDTASITNAQISLKRAPTGYAADKVKFDKIVLYNGEVQVLTPLFLSKQIDFVTHSFPEASIKAMEQANIRFQHCSTFQWIGLIFNFGKVKAVTDYRVRQAIAMAIDKTQTASVGTREACKTFDYVTGAADQIMKQWVPAANLERLNKYIYNPDKATQLMLEAGFKKQNGIWVSPQGEKMEYDLFDVTEYNEGYSENIVNQLIKWGIKLTLRTITYTQFSDEIGNGNFQLATKWFTGGTPHPYYSYLESLLTYNSKAPGGGMKFPLKQTSPTLGAVDFEALVNQSAKGLDIEQQKATITKLATAFNELLPHIPIYQRMGFQPILQGKRVTGWPSEDDPLYKNSLYDDNFISIMMLNGTLKAVER